MHILFITDNFPPEVNAPATRTYEHCKYWVEAGAKVTVITCNPNFPQGKLYKGYRNRWIHKETMDGIHVIRTWSYIHPNEGFAMRILDHLSFAFTSFWQGLFLSNIDIIVATSPQFFTTFSAYSLSLFKRKPWVFEVRDMWPEGIIFLKKDTFLYKFLEKIELFLYRKADHIITVTESFRENISKRASLQLCKITTIYNGANNALFVKKDKDEYLLEKLNLSNKFVIGYAGTLGVSHNLDVLIDRFKNIENINPSIHFLFIGDGAVKSTLLDKAKQYDINNFTLLPPVSKDEIINYISLFDVGLVPLKKNPAYLKVIPSKIFELSAMNIPILLGVEGEVKNILLEYQAGISYIPDSLDDFEKSVLFLADDDNLRLKYKSGQQLLANNFDRKKLAYKMYDVLQKVIKK